MSPLMLDRHFSRVKVAVTQTFIFHVYDLASFITYTVLKNKATLNLGLLLQTLHLGKSVFC